MESNMKELFSVFGDNSAIIADNKVFSYNELIRNIEQYESYLINNKISSGDIVTLISDYNFDSISLLFALYIRKCIIVPITSTAKNEIESKIKVANSTVIINLRDNSLEKRSNQFKKHEIVSSLIKERKSGLVLFSSGSTGEPKGMVHDFDNVVSTYYGKRSKNLVFLVFLLFDHIGGLNTLLNSLFMGSTIVIPTSRTPEEIFRLIQEYKINVLPASPTFLNLLYISNLSQRYDLSSLIMITYGTEKMPESLLVKLKEIFPRVKFLQTFGTSETGIIKTVSKSSNSTLLKFDDPDQEYKVENGELWLRSKTRIKGYLNYSSNQFTEEGWFKTGDLVEEAENGFLRIVGRKNEVINVGGQKVIPSEVENIILEIPEVLDCTVYGRANAITGNIVCAKVVILQSSDFKKVKAKIKILCNEKLDGYKVPVKIELSQNIDYNDRFKKKVYTT